MSEYAPPTRKVYVTKKQLREQQEAYKRAEELAEDHAKEEAEKRKIEVARLEKKLEDEDIFLS